MKKKFMPLLVIPAVALSLQAEGPDAPQVRPQDFSPSDQVPEGLAKSDWASIRAAYDAGRYSFQPTENGHEARNPGQQWRTQFDGRGFTIKPIAGEWSWGLELQSYGFAGNQNAIDGKAPASIGGSRLIYSWDGIMSEWFVNDKRGTEAGWTVAQRPPGARCGEALKLTLSVRGELSPRTMTDGLGVAFYNSAETAVVNFSGLKAWDADGKVLRARFEPIASGSPRIVSIVVAEQDARYPITIDPVAHQAFLKASNTGFSDGFGGAVAVSGDTVVVGASGEDSSTTGVNPGTNEAASGAGAAYVFVRNGTTWSQQAFLKASNTGFSDGFGGAVAVSGDTVVVGASGEASSTTGVNPGTNEAASGAGAAYVFVRNGTTWSQQAFLKAWNTGFNDGFGGAVAVSGDTVVVGASGEDSSTTGVNPGTNEAASGAGAAYVFVRNGTTWSQQAFLKAWNTDPGDGFGGAVAVSGDTVLVGAVGEDSSTTGVNPGANEAASGAGAAYVFVRDGTTWSQQAFLKAWNTDPGDGFGGAVAVSGDTVVVGASGEDSSTTGVNPGTNEAASGAGAAYVFVRNGTTWSQQAFLKAWNTDPGDGFGGAVAVSGDTVLVGAVGEDSSTTGVNPGANEAASGAGAAYVFVRDGTTWSQQAFLKAWNTDPGDGFGGAVAVSGDTVVVGASGEDSSTTGVNPGTNEAASAAGAAYVYNGIPAPEIVIEQPVGSNIADGGSKSFGSVATGSSLSLTFTIRNLGTANLTGLTITKDGPNASEFVVTSNPVAPVTGPSGTTFTVNFTPTGTGVRTAAIHIASNDAEESPFDITLTGTGVTAPEIAVEQPAGTNIADGGSKAFGSIAVGDTTSLTFTIKNTGSANLTGLTITKDGTNAADFTVTANPTAPVSGPSGSTTFTLQFAPGGTGNRTAAIHIASNDSDENPFDINLSGTGLAPEIAVEQPVENNIADGGSTTFGSVSVGGSASLTFTIKNTGNGNLTGLAITKDGTNASEFTVTANPAAPVSGPSGSTTFTLQFAPGGAGSRTAAIHIASNDSDENPFDINLSGTGAASVPVVGSPTSTGITASAATLGGTVSGDGGSAITGRGVVYALTSVNPAPQLGGTGVTTVTSAGTTGTFTVNVTGLVPNSAYSFAAYATNALGTAYSATGAFTTSGPSPSVLKHAIPSPALATAQSLGGLGSSVAVEGRYAVTGVPNDDSGGANSGVVKVFDTVTGALLHVIPNPTPAASDNFGYAVAVSGTRVVAGSYGDDTGATDAGVAYVFDLETATPTVPVITLPNPGSEQGDNFGRAVAFSGSCVVIGASLDDTGASDAGVAYVFELDSATPSVPAATFNNPAPDTDDGFGFAVAISGSRVVVGSHRDDAGAANSGSAYVYDLDSGTPASPILTLGNPSPAADDNFGVAVSISGSRVVVGSYRDDAGAANSGSAYVYDLDSGTPASPILTLGNPNPAADDNFGVAVSISGSRVVVGTSGDDTGATDAGSAYVFDLSSATPAMPTVTLNNPTPENFDRFGSAVAISGTRVLVGAPSDDTGASSAGSAYVYVMGGSSPGVPTFTLNHPGQAHAEQFGNSSAISGNFVVVGAWATDNGGSTSSGSAFVYDLSSATPTVPVVTLNNPSPANSDLFGVAVAISGTRVVVGAYGDDTGASNAGSAYVYDLNSGTPAVPVVILNNPSPATNDEFGRSVAISGTRVIASASRDDTGATDAGTVYVYDLTSGTPTVPLFTINNPAPAANGKFGEAVAIVDTRLSVGRSNALSVDVYDLGGASPTVPLLTLTSPANPGGGFGTAVAMSGTRLVVGAYGHRVSGVDVAGSAYVYDLNGAAPTTPVVSLNNPSPELFDNFGYSVAISGNWVIAGTPDDDTGDTDSGATYVFDLTNATPGVPVALLNNPTAQRDDEFGRVVAIDGSTIVAAAQYDDSVMGDAGHVYIFGTGASASTQAATGVTATSATLNAIANAGNVSTNLFFDVSTDGVQYTAYAAVPASVTGGSTTAITRTLTGLAPATTHRFRIRGVSGTSTCTGTEQLFTTLAPSDAAPPAGGTMTLTPASPVDPSAAVVVSFAGWSDASLPLSYAVLIDDVVVSAQGATASRSLTAPAAPGTHVLKGRIYDALNNVAEVTQNFTVNTPQESWRQQFFGSTANSGNAADEFDFDGDGLANLIEFAFGLNPTSGGSIQLPQGQVSGGQFVFSFPTPPGVSGVTYGAEWSTTLSSNPANWTAILDSGTSGNHVFSIPVGSNQRLFVRLKVTRP